MFPEKADEASASRSMLPSSNGSNHIRANTSVAITTSIDAGSSRRARRAQNDGRWIVPVSATSVSSSDVISRPETTKKTSTPM
jgi:hypothetical protein